MGTEEPTDDWGESQARSASTSSGLLDRLRDRDPETWRQWADLYGPLIYSWCRRYGLQPADAADVFQEVFAAVSRGIDGFERDRSRGRFRGWLWTIARNKIRDHFRHRSGREEAAGGSDALARLADVPEELDDSTASPSQAEWTAVVQRAIGLVQAEFEPTTWRAFWRTTIDRQEAAAVAAELGISLGAVRIAKSRVLRRIRAVVEPGDENC